MAFSRATDWFVTAVQTYDGDPKVFGDYHGHLIKTYVTDLKGTSFDPLLGTRGVENFEIAKALNPIFNTSIISSLPRDPRNVLVEDRRVQGNRDIYLVDAYTLSTTKVMNGTDRFDNYQADLNGVIRARNSGL